MLTSGCPSDFHHVQTTALHAHIQWSTACTHLVVHRMHTSSGPPDAAHPVVHRMRHIRWTTSGTFPDAWGCDIRWSTGGQPVDHRMWRSPVDLFGEFPIYADAYISTQISYAPKALDRSLAAYLRCDLKANVFCLLLRLSRVLWKQLRTYAVFIALIFINRTF